MKGKVKKLKKTIKKPPVRKKTSQVNLKLRAKKTVKKIQKKNLVKKPVAKKKLAKKIKKLIKKTAEVKNKIVKKAVKKASRNNLSKSKPIILNKKPNLAKKGQGNNPVVVSNQPNYSFKPKIRLIGIGGGGGSIVWEMSRSLKKTSFVVADTDTRAFKKDYKVKYFFFGKEITHGLGTGLNTDVARLAAEKDKKRIGQLFLDKDIIILISCLGGGLGSGATPIFSAPENFNGISMGIFTLPFRFEGSQKYNIAKKALNEIRESLNVSLVIDNEKIFKIIDNQTPITHAFSLVNKNLMESLSSLIDLIYDPGIINIDFADLKAILKGKGNVMFLNTVEASGKDRAEKIAQTILRNPLYQTSSIKADRVLFNFSSGQNLSMFEVNSISQAIANVNPQAKIIFGISKNKKYKNIIRTTLLMIGSSVIANEKNNKENKRTTKKSVKKLVDKKNNQERAATPVPNVVPLFDVNYILSKNINSDAQLKNEESAAPKKIIRRSGLEAKKSQQEDVQKNTQQEKEWEIPAFLRFKK